MLFTPTLTYLSLAFNFGALLLLHESDPNLVTTRRNIQRSVRTIESAATESWTTITMHYNGILSSLASSASSVSFVGRAERIYRSCVVRILVSLDSSISHSLRTSKLSPSFPLSLVPLSPSSLSLTPPSHSSPALSSTSLSARINDEIALYIPFHPVCSIFNAPFVVDYVEHPWDTPGLVRMNPSRLWPLFLCVLVPLVNYIWIKVVRSPLVSFPNSLPQLQGRHRADVSDAEVEPTNGTRNGDSALPPSSYIGSVATFMDADSIPDSNSKFDVNPEPEISLTGVEIPSLPRALPVVITTSDGRVLFNAEITLSSNHIISTSPSSIQFSVDVVAFRNLSPCKSHFPFFLPTLPTNTFTATFEDIHTTQNDGDSADSRKSTLISNYGESDIVSLPPAPPAIR